MTRESVDAGRLSAHALRDGARKEIPTTIRVQSVLGHTRLIPAPRNRNGEAPSQHLAKH
jgi:hypothetical protein